MVSKSFLTHLQQPGGLKCQKPDEPPILAVHRALSFLPLLLHHQVLIKLGNGTRAALVFPTRIAG